MADAAVDFSPTDIFDLSTISASFQVQSSSDVDTNSYAQVNKADGDNCTESGAFDERNEVSAVYRWCASTGLESGTTGMGAFGVGDVRNSFLITQIQLDTSNEDYPTITVTGHQHDDNPHTSQNVYDWPAGMLALMTGAFGCYDFINKDSATAACQSETLTMVAEHVDVLDATGDHFAGHTFRGRIDISCTHVGAVSGADASGGDAAWAVDTQESTGSNETFDTTVTNAHIWVTRT